LRGRRRRIGFEDAHMPEKKGAAKSLISFENGKGLVCPCWVEKKKNRKKARNGERV